MADRRSRKGKAKKPVGLRVNKKTSGRFGGSESSRSNHKKQKYEGRTAKRVAQKQERDKFKATESDVHSRRKNAVLGLIRDEMYVPMKAKELAVVMQVANADRGAFHQILDELVEEGKISITKKGRYLPEEEKKTLQGVFIPNDRGFGFVRVEGKSEDYYIPKEYTNHAFRDDVVEIVPMQGTASAKHKTEARIVAIVSHGIRTVVGVYQQAGNYGFVIPDDMKMSEDVFIPKDAGMHAVDGHKVVVELTDYGSDGKNPAGKIVEILGHKNDPGVDIMSIVKSYEIPVGFPAEVLQEASDRDVEVSPEEIEKRHDLRDEVMVTIDGEDAKDLDDAVSVSKTENGYRLGVHIADVSYYVTEGSALDKEALERGTSVYLVDRVIPMLPHVLSNGICSLNQGENRLALSCIMEMDEKGNVIDHTIEKTVICVDRRMSYNQVQAVLDGDEDAIKEYAELKDMFLLMKELSDRRRELRHKRGSIDFDLPESKILLDEEGNPVEIGVYDRVDSTKIIEEFMLAANETVAQDFEERHIPFLYRTHGTPDAEKIRGLKNLLGAFGYTMHGNADEIQPAEVQAVVEAMKDTPQEKLISTVVLRSMQQAKYTVDNIGHFGLAAEYYSHFTSPIRRYPDLMIHRIISEVLTGEWSAKRYHHYESILPAVADRTSKLERRADETEREVDKLKKVQYISDHMGEIFEGSISGVTSWGFYVSLPNTIEGLVPMSALTDDFYEYDEAQYAIIGTRHNRHYTLGDPVRVCAVGFDTMARTIDFDLAEDSFYEEER